MVARISPSEVIQNIFYYNENKVAAGKAELIGAGNYPVDHDQMNEMMRLNGLLKRIELSTKGSITSLHISLNFDVSETALSKDKLMKITDTYMRELGFGSQPYLVYQHFDAAHPHVHIVTTNIKPDGRKINLNHLAIRRSEPARKMIEEKFGLVKAEGRGFARDQAQSMSPEIGIYGKSETKKAIQKVLVNVIPQYKFSSLEELNAVLGLYNVFADRGTQNSRVHQHRGLLYHLLGPDGCPVGVPIKASLFYCKATLNQIEGRYDENKDSRKLQKSRVKNAVDIQLKSRKLHLSELITALRQQGIDVVLRKNDAGLIYGLTYVDHLTKCVFNGSELGKQYSARELQNRCTAGHENTADRSTSQFIEEKHQIPGNQITASSNTNFQQIPNTWLGDLIENVMESENVSNAIPFELRRKRRKKRRNNPSK